MATEKCDVVSVSLLRNTAEAGVSSSFYESFCLGIVYWCPCCVKTEERNHKSLTLKQRCCDSEQDSKKEGAKKDEESTYTLKRQCCDSEQDSKKEGAKKVPTH